MNNRLFQTVTQYVGMLTLIAFALYGVASMANLDTSLVEASSAETSTNRATSSINVPATFNYEGTLRNPDGTLKNGQVSITAKLYGAALGGIVVYDETFSSVNVREGEFNIVLGDQPNGQDLTAVFENNAPLYVGISIDGATEIVPRERVHPVPWAIHARDSYDGVPVGGVVDWWSPKTAANTLVLPYPDGFEKCDGHVVNDPASPLNGYALPNFTNRFALGLGLYGDHNVGNRNEGVQADFITTAAGEHNHETLTYNELGLNRWYGYDSSGVKKLAMGYSNDRGLDEFGNGQYYVNPFASFENQTANFFTSNAGEHTHQVDWQPYIHVIKLCRTR